MNREAIRFPNRAGRQLFGVFHPGGESRKDVCVVLLSPGIKNRVAPHRLYVKLSDRLQALGFDVFRFDPEGLGDSEGEFDARFVADLYGAIQVGRFSEDTAAALDWLEREKGHSRFIVGGLCGGAITGMLAGADDSRVAGLLSIGIPVVLDSSEPGKVRFMSEGQKEKLRKGYLARLLQPRSWLRFLTLKSNYRVLLRSILNRGKKQDDPKAGESQTDDIQFNRLFPGTFERFVAGERPVFLAFSGADRIYWEYKEQFAERHQSMLAQYAGHIDEHVIPGANHIMSFEEWQGELFTALQGWLDHRFPA